MNVIGYCTRCNWWQIFKASYTLSIRMTEKLRGNIEVEPEGVQLY